MTARLLLLLILLCASFPMMARDARMMGANGNGGGSCQDHDDTPARGEPAALPATRTQATHVTKPAKPTGDASHGSGNFDGVRPPRWHSFLPGMFR